MVNRKIKKDVLIGFYCLCILLLYIRNFFGVDLGDEPYHVSSVFQVMQGNVPLSSIWDGHAGFFLLAPFGILYKALVPSLDGVILYFREVGLSISILVSFVETWLISKKYEDTEAFYYLLPSCIIMPALVLYYNTAASILMCLICTLLYTDPDNGPRFFWRYFLTGMLAGLLCLNYPTFLIIAIFYFLYIFLGKRKKQKQIKKATYYFCGIALVGGCFLLWVFLKGGFLDFRTALNAIAHNPHAEYRGPINSEFIDITFTQRLKTFFNRKYSIVIVLYAICLGIIKTFKGFHSRESLSTCAFALYVLFSIKYNIVPVGYNILSIFLGFVVYMLFIDIRFFGKHIIYYLTILLYVLIYSFSSDNRNVLAAVGFLPQTIVFVILLTLYERSRTLENEKTPWQKEGYLLLVIILSITGLIYRYNNIYNDEPICQYSKNSRIENGVYKGLYTTEARKNYVESLENFIDLSVEVIPDAKEKKLCVVTLEPSVYLMSDARIYTPWTFDAQYLNKGFHAAEPILSYFQHFKQYPDIVVATNRRNPDFFENDEYEIRQTLEEKYRIYDKKNLDDGITACVWILEDDR